MHYLAENSETENISKVHIVYSISSTQHMQNLTLYSESETKRTLTGLLSRPPDLEIPDISSPGLLDLHLLHAVVDHLLPLLLAHSRQFLSLVVIEVELGRVVETLKCERTFHKIEHHRIKHIHCLIQKSLEA